MFSDSAKTPSIVSKTKKKIIKRHPEVLQPGEDLISAGYFVDVTSPQLSAIWMSFGALGALIGTSFAKKAAKARAAQIASQTGNTMAESPVSKNGFMLALTPGRLLILNRNVKEILAELPIRSFNYATVQHEKGAYSIILNSSVHGPLTFTSLIAQPKPAEHFAASLAQYVGSDTRASI